MGHSLTGTMNVDAQVALMADSGAHIIALQEVTVTSSLACARSTRPNSGRRQAGIGRQSGRRGRARLPTRPRATSFPRCCRSFLPRLFNTTLFHRTRTGWTPSGAVAQMAVSVNGATLNVFATHCRWRRTNVACTSTRCSNGNKFTGPSCLAAISTGCQL